jgi:hypothetical protein
MTGTPRRDAVQRWLDAGCIGDIVWPHEPHSWRTPLTAAVNARINCELQRFGTPRAVMINGKLIPPPPRRRRKP